jgi:hypothetical protein
VLNIGTKLLDVMAKRSAMARNTSALKPKPQWAQRPGMFRALGVSGSRKACHDTMPSLFE